jgi:hypothetical protein
MPKYLRENVGGMPPDASQLYYTVQLKNNNTGYDISGNLTSTVPAVPITFQETRSNPYLNKAGDYYMSVISFDIDTEALPVFICDPVVGNNDPTLTPYIISFTDGTINLQTNVVWIPQDKTAPLPPSPIPSNYSAYPYYYAYTYEWFINLVNTALAIISSGAGLSTTPFISLQNGLLALNVGSGDFSSSTYSLGFNRELYYLFSSFSAIQIGNSLPGYGLNNEFQLCINPNNTGENYIKIYTDITQVPPTTFTDGYQLQAEYSPFPFWNPVDSIVFTVQQLTTVPEIIAKPVSLGNDQSNVGTNADTYYVLTDFASPLTNGTEYHPNISYEPQAEFRLTELYGEEQLSSLNFSLFWKDKFGLLHPLTLEAGGSAYIKILFRLKSFYKDEDKE